MEKEKVVKCRNKECNLHFGYAGGKKDCPFCHTPYAEAEKATPKKIEAQKPHKETFKFWKGTKV